MGDIILRKRDGWQELGGVSQAIQDHAFDIDALWRAVAAGDTPRAIQVIMNAGYTLEGRPKHVRVLAIPDDLLGETFRVWAKFR